MYLVITLCKIYCVILLFTPLQGILIEGILNNSNFQTYPSQEKLDNINPDTELPEYQIYKSQIINDKDASSLNKSQVSNTVERLSPVLCKFSDVSKNDSPTFAIYCIIIALAWLCLMITLCFGYLRQTLERLRGIIHQHGFRNNRTYNLVNTDRT